MAKLPFMRVFPKDFFGDAKVVALSTEERGVYMLLLMRMWQNQAWISADDRIIARLLDMDLRRWKRVYKPKIVPLLQLETDTFRKGFYTQKRLTETWRSATRDAEHAAMMREKKAVKSGRRYEIQEPPNRAPQEPQQEPDQWPYSEGISHSSDKEAADAAANHKASKEAAASLASGALHPREEPRPDVDERDQRRGAREDHQELPKPQRAMGGADPGASSLYARLAAERRRRATEDGKEED